MNEAYVSVKSQESRASHRRGYVALLQLSTSQRRMRRCGRGSNLPLACLRIASQLLAGIPQNRPPQSSSERTTTASGCELECLLQIEAWPHPPLPLPHRHRPQHLKRLTPLNGVATVNPASQKSHVSYPLCPSGLSAIRPRSPAVRPRRYRNKSPSPGALALPSPFCPEQSKVQSPSEFKRRRVISQSEPTAFPLNRNGKCRRTRSCVLHKRQQQIGSPLLAKGRLSRRNETWFRSILRESNKSS